jgi:hypothetical protein
MLCSICFNDIPAVGDWTSGNNAEPINAGRCCKNCDDTVVFPARLNMMMRGPEISTAYMQMRREQFEIMRQQMAAEPAAS